MKNLLDSTDIATLFLDDDLKVRRFTNQMSKIIKLIPGDVGRPITDIASELEYPGLVEDVQEVLRMLAFKESTVAARGGSWYQVRIMPYRTLENQIDGVVITFMDVTVSKSLEMQLRKMQAELERRVIQKAGGLEKARNDNKEISRRRRKGKDA
jgi:two-component system CheB/CheR fusion protein